MPSFDLRTLAEMTDCCFSSKDISKLLFVVLIWQKSDTSVVSVKYYDFCFEVLISDVRIEE